MAEALAVLLQTWNRVYYQYRKFDVNHFTSIERLLSEHNNKIAGYRNQAIDKFDHSESTSVASLFQAFEDVLGPVGAAKALHLLAPWAFSFWDRAIAEAYDLTLGKSGKNGDRYWRFMLISQRQCLELKEECPDCQNPLKSIDEYNYCKYTKGWPS